MKFLLETALSIIGIVVFLVIAFLSPDFFWVGLIFLLVFGVAAFVLGFFRRTKKRKQTLKEVIKELDGAEKRK